MVFGPLTGSQFLQGRDQSCVFFIRLCWVPAMMTYLGIKQHSSKSQNQDYIIFGVFPHRGSDCFCHSREILVATWCHEGHLLGQMSGGLTTFINWATERFMVLQNWRQYSNYSDSDWANRAWKVKILFFYLCYSFKSGFLFSTPTVFHSLETFT